MRKIILAMCAMGCGVWACVGDAASSSDGSDGGAGSDASVTNDGSAGDAGGSDAGSDSGSFSPTQLPGLALWLDAAHGVTGTSSVTAWNDQSGHSNNAFLDDAGGAPSLVASAFHGLPALHFDPPAGADALVVNDATSLDVDGDFLMEAVFDFRNTTEYSSILLKQNAGAYPYPGPCIFVNYPTYSGDGGLYTTIDGQLTANYSYVDFVATATQGLNDGTPRLFGFRRVGTTIESRLNGAPSITHPDAGLIDVSSVGWGTYVGSRTLKGDIAEVVMVNGATSDSDLAALEGYLKSKYGL